MGLLRLQFKILLDVLGVHVDGIELNLDIALVYFGKGLIEGVLFLHSANVAHLIKDLSCIFDELGEDV